MQHRLKRPHEGLCPFYCKKIKEAHNTIEKTLKEKDELKPYRDTRNSVINFYKEGYQILGIEEHSDFDYVVVMSFCGNHSYSDYRNIFLYNLPFTHWSKHICRMDLRYEPNCCAKIMDWSSYPTNMGYGSILMKYLIAYLRSAGFRTLYGEIVPRDYNHIDLLFHFYKKFGFKIEKQKQSYGIYLDLYDKPNIAYCKDCLTVCCRDSARDLMALDESL